MIHPLLKLIHSILLVMKAGKTSFAAIETDNTALHYISDAFRHFPPICTPTFKTKALRLVNKEGRVKRLFLLYTGIIQSFLAVNGDVFRY